MKHESVLVLDIRLLSHTLIRLPWTSFQVSRHQTVLNLTKQGMEAFLSLTSLLHNIVFNFAWCLCQSFCTVANIQRQFIWRRIFEYSSLNILSSWKYEQKGWRGMTYLWLCNYWVASLWYFDYVPMIILCLPTFGYWPMEMKFDDKLDHPQYLLLSIFFSFLCFILFFLGKR